MTRLTRSVFAVAVISGAVIAVTLAAQSGSPSARVRRVWTGTIDNRLVGVGYHDSAPIRRPVDYSHDIYVNFRYVSEVDPDTREERVVSRWISWTARGRAESSLQGSSCEGSDSFDLGPASAGISDALRDRLKVPCRGWQTTTGFFVFQPEPEDQIPLPNIPSDLRDCETRQWTHGTTDYSVSVSGAISAVVDVEAGEYDGFVPEPGKTLAMSAKSFSGPLRFRFELDPAGTSRFPGYATNAHIDDVFFLRYNLGHLRGAYANDAPDMIFNSDHFGRNAWSRVEPLAVETRTAEASAVALATAMDYGAVGRLRAFAGTEGCGAWQPIPFRVGGQDMETLELPADRDKNLIADALEQYRGLESGADLDSEPKGNGMAGDGLTAFEEYRGFFAAGGPEGSCEPLGDTHVRTNPVRKNLFVLVENMLLAESVDVFAQVTGLALEFLCGRHLIDGDTILQADMRRLSLERTGEWSGTPDARVVNFTLQQARLREWNGRTVSQEAPQRAVVVREVVRFFSEVDFNVAVPTTPGAMGPPKLTTVVGVRVPVITSGEDDQALMELGHAVLHELSHAVGVPHHSDTVEDWKIQSGILNIDSGLSPYQRAGGPPDFSQPAQKLDGLLIDQDSLGCSQGVFFHDKDEADGRVSARYAGCLTPRIVRRGQQNSGEMDCLMRYPYGENSYYEPPGSRVEFRATTTVFDSHAHALQVDHWAGRLLRYRSDRERIPLGGLCRSPRGTGINSGGGDANHSGDAARTKPCSEFLVVNDVLARNAR